MALGGLLAANFTTVAPCVTTGGMVRVKEGAYLGIGATVLPEVTMP